MNDKIIKPNRAGYAHQYYILNKDKKKKYYDAYYKNNKTYIKQYNLSRKAKVPTEFNKEYVTTHINWD